jgi:Notch-like protein
MNKLVQTFSKPFPKIIVKNITTTEIEKIIKCLKPSNSHGYDEISTKILKYSVHMISSPLTYILNLALSTGIFPARMKYSIVKPLFKKGDKSDISNYRPISLLTSFSKIFEKNYI